MGSWKLLTSAVARFPHRVLARIKRANKYKRALNRIWHTANTMNCPLLLYPAHNDLAFIWMSVTLITWSFIFDHPIPQYYVFNLHLCFSVALSQLEVNISPISFRLHSGIREITQPDSVTQFVLRTWAFPITPLQLYKELLRKLLLIHIYLFKFLCYVNYRSY